MFSQQQLSVKGGIAGRNAVPTHSGRFRLRGWSRLSGRSRPPQSGLAVRATPLRGRSRNSPGGNATINLKYAGHVNRAHHRVGHLIRGRFKSVLVESGGHLRELTRYIHLNPVRAGLGTRPADYAWSSYRAYLGLKKCPDWLRTETTLERFGKSAAEQRRAYREFVEEEVAVSSPLADLRFGVVLGSEQFVEWARGKLKGEKGPPAPAEVTEFRRARVPADLDRVCEVVSRSAGVDEGRLSAKGLWRNDDRDLAIYLAVRHTASHLSEIGERLGGLGASAVSQAAKRLERRMSKQTALRRKVQAMEEDLGTPGRKDQTLDSAEKPLFRKNLLLQRPYSGTQPRVQKYELGDP